MCRNRVRLAVRAAAAFVFLAAALPAASTMKMVVAELPLPADDKPVLLSGLSYDTMAWHGRVEAIRLKAVPAEGAKKVTWLVRASNSRGSRMRIDVDLHLLGADAKRLASGRKTLLLGAATSGVEYGIDVVLGADLWNAARSLRVEVRFISN